MKSLKKQVLITNVLLHALLLITVYILQSMFFPFMRIGGLVPLALPLVVAGVALYEGKYTGGVVGIFAGILCDMSFNNPVGVFTVFLTIAGLVIGALSDTIVLRGFVTYYIACAGILILSAMVQMFPMMFLQGYPFHFLIDTAIGQTVYSLILAFPIWFPVRALAKRVERFTPSHIPQERMVNFRFASFKRSGK